MKTLSVQLHLKAFGLEGVALRVRNALTQVPLTVTAGGQLTVPCREKSFILVSLTRAQ
jgi:hypothetical protein